MTPEEASKSENCQELCQANTKDKQRPVFTVGDRVRISVKRNYLIKELQPIGRKKFFKLEM